MKSMRVVVAVTAMAALLTAIPVLGVLAYRATTEAQRQKSVAEALKILARSEEHKARAAEQRLPDLYQLAIRSKL